MKSIINRQQGSKSKLILKHYDVIIQCKYVNGVQRDTCCIFGYG